ncbi:head-tail joining protein [Ectopseudomonas khazarica]|uniref:head-tail joining protein n=1 Tax=Ectopseudomonas khazarica TaxID=2502979 RepID=UPI003B92D215
MSWAAMRDRMHQRVVAHLKDGCAEYQPSGGLPSVRGVEVMVDENLMQNGPDGMIPTEATGITWRKAQLQDVTRGGVFLHAGRRFIVEQKIMDDGHMATAACMEVKP